MRKEIDYNEWFQKNQKWLRNWIKNAKPHNDYVFNGTNMQIIRSSIGKKSVDKECVPIDRTWFADNEKNLVREKHIFDMLVSAVFSLNSVQTSEGGGICRTMCGFIEQNNRLPTKKDKVHFLYLSGNRIKRWFVEMYYIKVEHFDAIGETLYIPTYEILSECLIVTKVKA